MHAIYVVVFHHMHDDLDDVIPHLGNAWIKPLLSSIGEKPLWLMVGDMVWGYICLNQIECRSVGIEPRMEFHAALMGFVYCKLQGVKCLIGLLPLFSRQKTTPWL